MSPDHAIIEVRCKDFRLSVLQPILWIVDSLLPTGRAYMIPGCARGGATSLVPGGRGWRYGT